MKHTLTSIKDTESGAVDIHYRPVYLGNILKYLFQKKKLKKQVISKTLNPEEFDTVPPFKRVY